MCDQASGNGNMGQIAYNIKSAASATSLTEHAIKLAIREDRLIARELDGMMLILRTDIQGWLESLPRVSAGKGLE